MRRLRATILICLGVVLPTAVALAASVQSSQDGGALWARRDGSELVLGGRAETELRVDLPPGATIRTLEPIADGWLAAGRLPDGNGTDLLLIAGGVQGADLLTVPDRGEARYRGQPFLFVEDGSLVGLAWAAGAGPRELEIWAAPWREGRWDTPELVSAKGVGSQVAPRGAVLEDGSWLLVWTAFDGQDSEVLFSRRQGAGWTGPESIHLPNDVPDILPDVVPVEGGALATWSWFDGSDYRLKSARLVGDRWTVSAPFGGKGSGEPSFFRTADRILLLYSSVIPMSWSVVEVDSRGHRRRQAVAPVDTYRRPLLVLGDEDEGLLRWPEHDHPLTWRDLP